MVNLVKLCGIWVCLFCFGKLQSHSSYFYGFLHGLGRKKRNPELFCNNGGQKCWDLSIDITKTSDPSPPTPNKVEFGAKWVKLSAFFCQNIARGSGGGEGGEEDDGMNPKPNIKIVLRSRILRNYCLEGLLHTVPSSFVLHWRFSATIVFHFYCDSAKGAKKWTTLLKTLTVFWPFGRSWTLETSPFSGIWPQRSRRCSHTPEGIHLSLVWETLKQPK